MKKTVNHPFGNKMTVEKLGQIIRARRKAQKLTQKRLAVYCKVGTRFISDLENGKATIELGKTIVVLACLGLEMRVTPRGLPTESNK